MRYELNEIIFKNRLILNKQNISQVRRIVVACDAGMGSSAMGAGILRKKMNEAGIDIHVINTSINALPEDVDIVITHKDLTNQAKQYDPNAQHISLTNFLDSELYVQLVDSIKQKLIENNIPLFENINNTKNTFLIFQLLKENIFLNLVASNKEEAINFAGQKLFEGGYVQSNYIKAMFAGEALTSTYLGESIGMPHGIIEAKDDVLKVGECYSTEIVNNVDGVLIQDNKVIELISQTDLITTALGPNILEKVASTIAQVLILRINCKNIKPLNIIACENMVKATSFLQRFVLREIPKKYHSWIDNNIGFVDSAVDRIIPLAHDVHQDILSVTVESFSEWIVDENQFKGNIPSIHGMEFTDNLMAYIERKLFTLNIGHAINVYLGFYYQLDTIRDSILESAIRKVVIGAMEESGQVLIIMYNFDVIKHSHYIQKIISRFENPYLQDYTERVGRQPIRKLGSNDRLIRPLLGTLEYQISNQNLLIGIAAALNYRSNNDDQSILLADKIRQNGVEQILKELSSLEHDIFSIVHKI